MLDLRDLVHMFQGHLANDLVAWVHGSANAILSRFHVRSLQQQPGRRGGAEIECERAIWANGDTRRNGYSSVDVCGPGVEFLL